MSGEETPGGESELHRKVEARITAFSEEMRDLGALAVLAAVAIPIKTPDGRAYIRSVMGNFASRMSGWVVLARTVSQKILEHVFDTVVDASMAADMAQLSSDFDAPPGATKFERIIN